MKNLLILSFILLLFTGCKKHKIEPLPTGNTENPYSQMLIHFSKSYPSDYTIFFSASFGSSIFEQSYDPSKASLIVSGYEDNRQKWMGDLLVNNHLATFNNGISSFQTTPDLSPVNFIGKMNWINFKSKSQLPALSNFAYMPSSTKLAIEGLEGDKVTLTNPLKISWTVDSTWNTRKEKSLLMLWGEKEDGTDGDAFKLFEVDDNSGTYMIPIEALSAFAGYDYLKVYYTKGYTDMIQKESSRFKIQTLIYNYTSLVITN